MDLGFFLTPLGHKREKEREREKETERERERERARARASEGERVDGLAHILHTNSFFNPSTPPRYALKRYCRKPTPAGNKGVPVIVVATNRPVCVCV